MPHMGLEFGRTAGVAQLNFLTDGLEISFDY